MIRPPQRSTRTGTLVPYTTLVRSDSPCDVRNVDHAIDVAVETNEQAEFGGVLDFAFDHAANRVTVSKAVPRIGLCLLEAQRNAALVFVHFQHHDVDFLAGGHDLARMEDRKSTRLNSSH